MEVEVESTMGNRTSGSTTVVTSPLPSPFDGNLAATFFNGASCPNFINNFLTAQEFQDCYPFSLLVQGSSGFFQAEKSAFAMEQILQHTCAAEVDSCAPYLWELAQELVQEENCGEEYKLGVSTVKEAFVGLTSYRELYSASCLKEPAGAPYCFTNAVTNYTNTANTYLYLLPLNISLPATGVPTCNYCVQNTMNIFHSATADRRLPIANTYAPAAQQINSRCGSGWVNETLPVAVTESDATGGLWRGRAAVAVAAVLLAAMQQQLS